MVNKQRKRETRAVEKNTTRAAETGKKIYRNAASKKRIENIDLNASRVTKTIYRWGNTFVLLYRLRDGHEFSRRKIKTKKKKKFNGIQHEYRKMVGLECVIKMITLFWAFYWFQFFRKIFKKWNVPCNHRFPDKDSWLLLFGFF